MPRRKGKKAQKGGDFIGDLNKGFNEVNKFLKKTQVISKGLKAVADPAGQVLAMIPHPAGQVAAALVPTALNVASGVAGSYGYGRMPSQRMLLGPYAGRLPQSRHYGMVGGGASRTVRGSVIYT